MDATFRPHPPSNAPSQTDSSSSPTSSSNASSQSDTLRMYMRKMALSLTTAIRGEPAAPAIIVPAKPIPHTITYSRLRTAVATLQSTMASTLSLSRWSPAVSMALPNSPELVVCFLAVAAQRGIAAPLNPAYTQSEFEYYIGDVGSALVLVQKGAVEARAPVVHAARRLGTAIAEVWWDVQRGGVGIEVIEWGRVPGVGPQRVNGEDVDIAEPGDVALVLHTSGTTSRPKMVPLTHRNLTRTMKNIRETYELTEADRTMLVMPLFHIHGLVAGLLAPLGSGGSVILPPRFSASHFWSDFSQNRATWYTAVPAIHQILLRNPAPSPTPYIRFIRSCSSPLAPSVLVKLEQTYNAPVVEAYAMTEAAHQMTSNPLPPHKRKPGTVGLPQGVDLKILDYIGEEVSQGKEGEVCIRGENVTRGYLNNPPANASSYTPDGWFRTGDQGKLDEDGYLIITGRLKEIINKAGEKISPVEIDNLLMRHPAVGEAVSFAVEDEMYGQDIGVAISVKPGHKLEAEDVRLWVAERAAKYKVPKKVFFTDTMPKTATGKIQRRIVAETMIKEERADLLKARL